MLPKAPPQGKMVLADAADKTISIWAYISPFRPARRKPGRPMKIVFAAAAPVKV
jgi:hypothetical protein